VGALATLGTAALYAVQRVASKDGEAMSKRVMATRFPNRRGAVKGKFTGPDPKWVLCLYCNHKIPAKDKKFHLREAHGIELKGD
jgi:hypothetical protein